jgi:spermidine synthase
MKDDGIVDDSLFTQRSCDSPPADYQDNQTQNLDSQRNAKSVLVNSLIYWLFFASGASALIYQVVWLRMLSRTTGVTMYATAVVVAAFMAGLSAGSLLAGRFIDRRNDPLKIYAFLELLVAGTVLLIPHLFSASVPLFSYIYEASGENATITAIGTGAVALLTLLVPTALMGATLPVLTAHQVRKKVLFGKSLSLLYGINTLGAVCGIGLGTFFLIGIFGERAAIYLAVAINVLVAGTAFQIARIERRHTTGKVRNGSAGAVRPISEYSAGIRKFVLLAFAISGFTSLAYEVIWTRQLILFLENSIYAFAAMLAVFLAGISLGSMSIHKRVDVLKSPLFCFGLLELAVGTLSVLNLYFFSPLDHFLVAGRTGWGLLPIVATVILVFPMTFAFGMILPIAGRCYTRTDEETGSSVGRLYGFNTTGCILGSLVAGFVLVPAIGSTRAVVLLALVNTVLGLLLVGLEIPRSKIRNLALVPFCLIFVVLVLETFSEDPFLATISKRIHTAHGNATIFMNKEAIEGTVTAFAAKDIKQLLINGIGVTFLCTEAKLMAHLPMMFAKEPKDFLVVCFGLGTTVKSASLYPGLKVTAVELVSETFDTFKFFHPDEKDLLKNGNIRLVANDGRNHLLLSPKRYDVISVDPAPPVWSARTVNLYTEEFFKLCKSRLNPGGVMCLWTPGGLGNDYLSLIKTFGLIFPNTTVWAGPNGWGLYVVGTMSLLPSDEIRRRINDAFDHPEIVKDLVEYDRSCSSARRLLSLLMFDNLDVKAITENPEIDLITDNFPLTEFFLWRHFSAR